jgi:thiamine biosynthesis lipoprotein
MSLDFGVVRNYRAVTPGLLSLSGETMGTHWLVRLAGVPPARLPELRVAVEAVFKRVIDQMSLWLPGSALSLYNAAAAGSSHVLPRDLGIVLDAALDTARASGGAFDPSVGALIELWGFGPAPRRKAPPEPESITTCLAQTGWQRLRVARDGERLLQPGGLRLDLSGVAKGYAVDAAAEALQTLGVEHCLVEIGGELAARGYRPDGSAWRVGVEAPSPEREEALLAVPLSGSAIATSGDRWHCFEHSGRRYSHTIDPRSGWPVPDRLASVTVVHESCMHADALATALYVLGLPDGLAFANRHEIAALFLARADQGIAALKSRGFERVLTGTGR